MAKVMIKGEVFAFEEGYPLAEAIALEEVLGMTFGEWIDARRAGSAKATAGFVWLVLKRAGRDVSLPDILSGKYELSLDDIQWAEPAGTDAADPTVHPPSTDTTDGGISASSLRSSDTPQDKSTS